VVPTSYVRRGSCGCPAAGLPGTDKENRTLFGQVQYLQGALNIQYELSIELLGTHEYEPRNLAWLGQTPAVSGCLGLWPQHSWPADARARSPALRGASAGQSGRPFA
jgi:hypothetical protein